MELDRSAKASPREVGALLLAALRDDQSEGASTRGPITTQLLEATSAAAIRHQVFPLFRHAVARWANATSPETPPMPLDVAIVAAITRHLQASAELDGLGKILDSTGVPWAVVKGPVLAELAYRDPALRPYADIDVLVHPQGFAAAIDALERAGARLLDQNWSLQIRERRAQSSFMLRYGTPLDLHWHLINDGAARHNFDWAMGATLESRRMVTIGSTVVPTLDPIDTLLHVALHAALSGGHRLLWAKDIECLTRASVIDWDTLTQRALDRRIALPVSAMFQRSRRLLGAEIPTSALRQMRRPRLAAGALSALERVATPKAVGNGSHTGRAFVANARRDGRSSLAALAVEVVHKTKRSERDIRPNPLEQVDVDAGARSRYLQRLDAAE